jgi:hypothetical protein
MSEIQLTTSECNVPSPSAEEAEQKARKAAYNRAYREANRAKIQARQKAWNEANRDRREEQGKVWREANKARRAASNKARYEAKKEALNAKNRAYHRANREALLEKQRARTKANRDAINARARDKRRLKLYGVTPEHFDVMLQDCEGRCPCCKTPFSEIFGERPCVDHCHYTGVVRGITCVRCNLLLGHAADKPKILRACAAYLDRAKKATMAS